MKDRKILCITRHSMRGADILYNSQTVKISDSLVIPCPFIAWSRNLSTYGKDLVNIKIIEDVLHLFSFKTPIIDTKNKKKIKINSRNLPIIYYLNYIIIQNIQRLFLPKIILNRFTLFLTF